MKKALLVTESSVYTNGDGKLTARGGGEIYMHNLAKKLLDFGVEPVIMAILEYKDQKAEEKIDNVLYKRFPVFSRTSWKLFKFLREAIKESINFDYVFLNQFIPHLILPWLKRAKKLAVVHDVYADKGFIFWIKNYGIYSGSIGYIVEKVQLFFDKIYSDYIVTVSKSSKKKIEALFKNKFRGRIVLNPSKVDKNIFSFHKDKNNYLLFAGRFVEYKNPEHVLFALKETKKQYPDFKAVFIVPRFTESTIKKFMNYAKNLGLTEKDIVIKEKCSNDEMLEIIKKAKILIHPSTAEGQGIIVLEAISCGTPVIAYDLEAYNGALINKVNSILVEQKNEKQLAKAVIEMLNNYQKYQEACRNFEFNLTEDFHTIFQELR